jgi:hypothetical protein
MSESYDQLRAAMRDRNALVLLDVLPPRDAPTKQFVAYVFEPGPGEPRPARPQGQPSTVAVTPEQAQELLAVGAEWKGPAHMREEILPNTPTS